MNKFKTLLLLALIPFAAFAQTTKVAIFSLNDFHGAFVRDDLKNIAGAPAIWQTLDSLKTVYPNNITLSAGDIFGGSYFYHATHGELLPEFFQDLGIQLSALGNHEFDDGQRSLADKWADVPNRPQDWDITYVCANCRNNETGAVPDFAQPVAVEPIRLADGRSVRVAFVGLIASSTPHQASTRNLGGLSFDGRYDQVLDSVLRLPEASLVTDANIRILLTHIGTYMDANGQPQWTDEDVPNLQKINSPLWNAIISSHSHEPVCGYINQAKYPIVQGKWHGDYISMLLCTLNDTTLQPINVEPQIIHVTPKAQLNPGPARLQAKIDSLLQHTQTDAGLPIGQQLTIAKADLPHDRTQKYRQTRVGELVCESFAEAYRSLENLPQSTPIVGCSHFGSIRAGFTKGPVTMLELGEVLPFSNALKAYKLTGQQIMDLVEYGLHNERYGWIQTGWMNVTTDADRHVTAIAYNGADGTQTPLEAKKKYILVTDEFITTGGDNYKPEFFPKKQLIKAPNLGTTTQAFARYLSTKKEI